MTLIKAHIVYETWLSVREKLEEKKFEENLTSVPRFALQPSGLGFNFVSVTGGKSYVHEIICLLESIRDD